MMKKKIVVQLKGGLGNQMFQYAAGRALAARSGAELLVDALSGFARDKVYRRSFELAPMPIAARKAGIVWQVPYWLERVRERVTRPDSSIVQERAWGTLIQETSLAFHPIVNTLTSFERAWMAGYWQSEKYFSEHRALISSELVPPAPRDPRFLELGGRMESCNSVAVGVRLFEEVPGVGKEGLGGVTPAEFYTRAAHSMSRDVSNPNFYVFCTTRAPMLSQLDLPGKIHFVTHEDGFNGALARLWLITRCRNHIFSNSSFYWWGAWLAEQRREGGRVVGSDMFLNRDCVPSRWKEAA